VFARPTAPPGRIGPVLLAGIGPLVLRPILLAGVGAPLFRTSRSGYIAHSVHCAYAADVKAIDIKDAATSVL